MKVQRNYRKQKITTYLAKNYDFHFCSVRVLVLFLCRRGCLLDFPMEKLVCHALTDPYIAKEKESQHRRPVKI